MNAQEVSELDVKNPETRSVRQGGTLGPELAFVHEKGSSELQALVNEYRVHLLHPQLVIA